jgi:hypothetical protein
MNGKVEHKVAGYYRFETFKTDADGNEIPGTRQVKGDWQKNLITDVGMDMLGDHSNNNYWNGCHVGTGTAAPANSNTALATFNAGIATTAASVGGVNGDTPYYGFLRRTFRFPEGTFASVNLTEAGIAQGTSGASGSARLSTAPLFSRVLINGGTGITVLVDESLDVIFEFRNYAPTTDVTGTVSISSVSYDFTVRACLVTSAIYWGVSTVFGWTGQLTDAGTSRTRVYSVGTASQNRVPEKANRPNRHV